MVECLGVHHADTREFRALTSSEMQVELVSQPGTLQHLEGTVTRTQTRRDSVQSRMFHVRARVRRAEPTGKWCRGRALLFFTAINTSATTETACSYSSRSAGRSLRFSADSRSSRSLASRLSTSQLATITTRCSLCSSCCAWSASYSSLAAHWAFNSPTRVLFSSANCVDGLVLNGEHVALMLQRSQVRAQPRGLCCFDTASAPDLLVDLLETHHRTLALQFVLLGS